LPGKSSAWAFSLFQTAAPEFGLGFTPCRYGSQHIKSGSFKFLMDSGGPIGQTAAKAGEEHRSGRAAEAARLCA